MTIDVNAATMAGFNAILSESLKAQQSVKIEEVPMDYATESLVPEQQVSDVVTTKFEMVRINSLPEISISDFKRALDIGVPVENLLDIAVNLVKQAISEKSGSMIITRGILREAIEARESPQVVGQIAASVLNAAVGMSELSQSVVKGMIGQILESNLNIRQITEILAEMVLEVEEKIQPEIIGSIINEEILSDEQLVEIHRYLLERDEQTADSFWMKAQQYRRQSIELSDVPVKEMNQSGMKSGLLSRLKAKLQGMKQVEVEENYSELNHRYAVMMARSNIEKRFL